MTKSTIYGVATGFKAHEAGEEFKRQALTPQLAKPPSNIQFGYSNIRTFVHFRGVSLWRNDSSSVQPTSLRVFLRYSDQELCRLIISHPTNDTLQQAFP